jgi:hypothetical protein
MRASFVLALAAALGVVLAGACAPLRTPLPPEPSASPSATPTLTATIQWFPPSATPTPLATVAAAPRPTTDLAPRYGTLLLSDDFDDPAQWRLGRMPEGSMALGVGELTLAVARPGGQLYSLRQDTSLGNFYLEVTASPSICRGEDEYGVMLKVSPSLEFFRFALTCDGRARVDRYYHGVASAPQPPAYFGAVPPGAPSRSRLGVWALGREMRFYANGEYLFSVSDPSLPAGSLALYARAAGEEMLTVNFSELEVYEALP